VEGRDLDPPETCGRIGDWLAFQAGDDVMNRLRNFILRLPELPPDLVFFGFLALGMVAGGLLGWWDAQP